MFTLFSLSLSAIEISPSTCQTNSMFLFFFLDRSWPLSVYRDGRQAHTPDVWLVGFRPASINRLEVGGRGLTAPALTTPDVLIKIN